MPARTLVLALVLMVLSVSSVLAQEKPCKLCGNAIPSHQKVHQASKGPACEDCWWKCTKCEMRLREGEQSPHWGSLTRLCKGCYERCEGCGLTLKAPRRGRVCEDCANRCTSCKERIYDKGHETQRGRQCDLCWNKSVRKCDVCGKALDVPGTTYYFYPGHSKFTCLGCKPSAAKYGEPEQRSAGAPADDAPRPKAPAPPPPQKSRAKLWVLLGGLGGLFAAVGLLLARNKG